jgi:hypothetical protein
MFKEYLKHLHSNKLDNLGEIDTFLDAYEIQKLNKEDINYLNRSTMSNDIEAVIESQQKIA